MAKVFVGTSGWSYEHWKGPFYPANLANKDFLEFYTKKFSTVEINSSFYHLPKEQTFKNWRDKTPKDFLFSVKVSRFITHQKKLKDVKEPWQLFWQRVKFLKEKLGPILFQLPPNFKSNSERLKNFLKILPKKQAFTFEFRHESWFCEEIYKILATYNSALTISDTPSYPYFEVITADFTYLRLHGHERLYTSNYQDKYLKKLSQKIKNWLRTCKLKKVFVYFDNDAFGYAPKNALKLKEFLRI